MENFGKKVFTDVEMQDGVISIHTLRRLSRVDTGKEKERY